MKGIMELKIEVASVKVMRSHDYCHFEVCLSSSSANTQGLVDELRKQAARLADKAVAQYKVAKANAERLLSDRYQRDALINEVNRIGLIEEGSRTVDQQAKLKAYRDEPYKARVYDYEDEWEESDERWG